MTKKSLRLLYKHISGILNMGAYHAKKSCRQLCRQALSFGHEKRSQLTLTPFFLLVKGDDNMTKYDFLSLL